MLIFTIVFLYLMSLGNEFYIFFEEDKPEIFWTKVARFLLFPLILPVCAGMMYANRMHEIDEEETKS